MNELPSKTLGAAALAIAAFREIVSDESARAWRDTRQYSLLHIACEYGEPYLVETLLRAGFDWKANTVDECNALDIAIHSGHVEIVELLFGHGAEIDSKYSSQNSLDLACAAGNLPMIEALLRCGADANGTLGRRQPIFWTLEAGSTEALRLIVDAGASVDAADLLEDLEGRNWTPLRKAAAEGLADAVELMVERGAEVNALDADGYTPLMLSLLYFHEDVAKKIIQLGGDIDIVANDGRTARDIIKENELDI